MIPNIVLLNRSYLRMQSLLDIKKETVPEWRKRLQKERFSRLQELRRLKGAKNE